jgi:hypothetical protein
MKFKIKRKRKILCITRPETVLRVFAFASLGCRLGPQILLGLANVPFLA